MVDDDTMRSSIERCGFTFVELLCVLLVIAVGMAGAIGLVNYGMTVAIRARAVAIGLATAVSVAKDPSLVLEGIDGAYIPYDFNDAISPSLQTTANGYLNGFYVVAVETSTPSDIVATGINNRVYVRTARVEVNVYEAVRGKPVASFVTRNVRQRGTP